MLFVLRYEYLGEVIQCCPDFLRLVSIRLRSFSQLNRILFILFVYVSNIVIMFFCQVSFIAVPYFDCFL